MTSLAVGKVKTPRVPFLGPKKSTVMKVMGVMKLPNSLTLKIPLKQQDCEFVVYISHIFFFGGGGVVYHRVGTI
jgi:hypothetical protein